MSWFQAWAITAPVLIMIFRVFSIFGNVSDIADYYRDEREWHKIYRQQRTIGMSEEKSYKTATRQVYK